MRDSSLRRSKWLYPTIGLIGGLIYAAVDLGFVDRLNSDSPAAVLANEFVDGVLPVISGLSIGAGIYLLRRQRRLVEKLSVKNEVLQNDLLFHTLISQMLHEIRNPVHTILAALENSDALTAAEQKQLILRNLGRFNELKKMYEEKETLFDRLDPRTAMRVNNWLPDLIEDKIKGRMKELQIRFSSNAVPVEIRIHPLLFEQIILTLFSNAIEAAATAPRDARWIDLDIRPAADAQDAIDIRLSNSGSPFPDDVIASQGNRPAKSQKGHGLGVLLAKKILDHADGLLTLRNHDGKAEVLIRIPGTRA